MADLATLQARLSELERIRASGVARAKYGDTDTAFRSDAELKAAISDIERQIKEAGSSKRMRQVRFSTRSGL